MRISDWSSDVCSSDLMHSGDNPEGDWGRHVIQAAQFGLAMLDRAFPAEAPFTPQNTKIIATGISNGGGAVLQAAGLDQEHFFAGVVALEPDVYEEERSDERRVGKECVSTGRSR